MWSAPSLPNVCIDPGTPKTLSLSVPPFTVPVFPACRKIVSLPELPNP
jgi:hypothetical protein